MTDDLGRCACPYCAHKYKFDVETEIRAFVRRVSESERARRKVIRPAREWKAKR